jgi:hypothetical protein
VRSSGKLLHDTKLCVCVSTYQRYGTVRRSLQGKTYTETHTVSGDAPGVSSGCGAADTTLPLVTKNVFSDFPIEDEPNPRRPFIDDADVDALFAVAPSIHPLLPLLMVLAGSTGRRLSSVLGPHLGGCAVRAS